MVQCVKDFNYSNTIAERVQMEFRIDFINNTDLLAQQVTYFYMTLCWRFARTLTGSGVDILCRITFNILGVTLKFHTHQVIFIYYFYF